MADPTSIASSDNYLRFDAFSFRDLIRQKLQEDPNFTDYVYDGSNLSVIIDIVSTLAQALMFNLNHAVSQVVFEDSSVYETMSKLCKFIGYNPRGYSAPEVTVQVTKPEYTTAGRLANDADLLRVPCYSTVTLDRNDRTGKAIKYSTTTFYDVYNNKEDKTNTNVMRLVNGEWKKYGVDFVAEGIPYEKFILDRLVSDSDASDPVYVAYPYVHVWVRRRVNGRYTGLVQYDVDTRGTFTENGTSDIYGSDDNVCMLRLNERKQYEIQFGDSVHGRALNSGDIVYVLYLQSNGPDGVIEVNELQNKVFDVYVGGCQQKASENERELTVYDLMGGASGMHVYNLWKYVDAGTQVLYNDELATFNPGWTYYSVNALSGSSADEKEEDVESMRRSAPDYFKSIGGVITAENFETAVKNRYWSQVVDVKVMNNYQYCATFFKWLQRVGLESSGDASRFLNESLNSYSLYGYKYVEAANQNDVYVWIKTSTRNTSIKNSILSYLEPQKPLTSRVNVCDAVEVCFDLCAGYIPGSSTESLRQHYNGSTNLLLDNFVWEDNGENRLEVEVENNITLSVQNLKETVAHTIRTFFDENKMNIGITVEVPSLTNMILAIPGVKNVRTVYRRYDEKSDSYSPYEVIAQSGVSLAYWNSSIVNGYDIRYSGSNVVLEPFQFPVWNDVNSIVDKIDMITEGSYNIVSVEKS